MSGAPTAVGEYEARADGRTKVAFVPGGWRPLAIGKACATIQDQPPSVAIHTDTGVSSWFESRTPSNFQGAAPSFLTAMSCQFQSSASFAPRAGAVSLII